MTNNTTGEEEFYPGFPTRWLLALSVALSALTCLFIFIRERHLDGLVNILAIQLTIHGLAALAYGWLTNRAQLHQRNLQDEYFFLIMGYLLTRLINLLIVLLTVLMGLGKTAYGQLSELMVSGLASFSPPKPLTVAMLLAGLFLLPRGHREPFGYPSFAWLLLPVAVLPPLAFLFYFANGGALTLALTLTAAIAGAVAVLGLRWLVESFLFFRRLEHILLFLPLGLLLGYFLEWLVFMGGALVIRLLFNVPASQYAQALGIGLAAFNLPGLLLGLLLGCCLLPRSPGR